MKIQIGSIEAEVLSNEEIAAKGAILLAVPVSMALKPFDEYYVPGTKAGFPCSVCSQDCILAPSGQDLIALGKNQIVCAECMARHRKRRRDDRHKHCGMPQSV